MRGIFLSILILIVFGLLSGCATTSMTPLSRAAKSQDVNTVKDLLAKGANACEDDGRGLSAFMYYIYNNSDISCGNETYRILVDNAYELVNKGGQCPPLLYYAAAGGCNDIVKKLLEKGKDSYDIAALSEAVYNGHLETAKILISKGADLDSAINRQKKLALDQSRNLSNLSIREAYNKTNLVIETLNSLKQAKIAEERRILEEKRKTEELKAIVNAAIEGAKTQKESKSPSVQSDIDKPTFAQSAKIIGENDLAVIIGIEGYQNIPKSDYSYDDAKLVKDYIKALGFKERNIELITDEKATKSSMEKSLEAWLKNKAKNDSKVFVYYSGHGAPDPSTGEAYLVPYDGDPNYLNVTGYPLKRLYDNLGKLQVAEVTVVLDACFSGAGGRSVLAKGARPLVMMTDIKAIPSNMAVLSATQGTQISTSSTEKGHGVFTYYFLKALKDGKKTIAEIYEYIKPLVEDEAKQLNVQQSPSVSPDIEKLKGRFGLRK